MKVRIYSVAAIAALALASQGVAQQTDQSLERALAELNGGLAAPAAQGSLNISGDFRVRNRWYNDGTETNNRDLDTRVRLNFLFQVTEASRAFVGFHGNEAWGGSVAGRHDVGSMSGGSFGEGLDRAWVEVDSLVGDGGTVRIGRSYYDLGSGRLLGSDTWDNVITTHSGVWYDRQLGPGSLHAAMMNGTENGLTGHSDNMLYVLGYNWYCDMMEASGELELAPYFIRDESTSGLGTGTHETWYGVQVEGEGMGLDYDFDVARYEFGDLKDGAWYANVGFDIAALGEVPGIQGGGVNVAVSNSDEDFSVPGLSTTGTYGVQYHDVVGFADVLGTAGIWTPDTDTWKVGVNVSPAEGWNGGLSVMNIQSGSAEFDEIDLSLGTQLGGNVMSWFGYAWIDPKGGADNMQVFWATFDLPFGG